MGSIRPVQSNDWTFEQHRAAQLRQQHADSARGTNNTVRPLYNRRRVHSAGARLRHSLAAVFTDNVKFLLAFILGAAFMALLVLGTRASAAELEGEFLEVPAQGASPIGRQWNEAELDALLQKLERMSGDEVLAIFGPDNLSLRIQTQLSPRGRLLFGEQFAVFPSDLDAPSFRQADEVLPADLLLLRLARIERNYAGLEADYRALAQTCAALQARVAELEQPR
jgi:hypothetical protein